MRHLLSHGHSPKASNNKSNNRESNIAIIAACSVAAFIFIALFLFCCLRGRRNKVHLKVGLRDDSPLPNFCSGNISRGSSVTYSLGNSGKKNFTSLSNVNSFSIKPGNSLAEEKVSEAVEVPPRDICANLPLPPGRVAPIPAPQSPATPKPAPQAPATPEPASQSPAAPKPAPPVPGSATPATEPASQDPEPAPPSPPPNNSAPRAPPPPIVGCPPPNPPRLGNAPKQGRSSAEADSHKAKLKPFFWDKVRANPEQSMVWNDIKAGSFQFNEEIMEDLFGYNKVEKNKNDQGSKKQSAFETHKYIQIIDLKKAYNLSILLKASNVTTEEVCDAIQEGNELPAELIETLLKMAPTSQEELQLRLYSEDISKLGPADQFIRILVDIPFAYKRLEILLFMCSLQNETSSIKDSLAILEVACKELKNNRLFLKLLEAVLKTGNRMNDGTFRGGAHAFKLDTLLKLSDVKGADGKTTLLHFVLLEIIRSEGVRAARRLKESSSMNSVKTEDLLEDSVQETPEKLHSLGLDVVSNLSNELAHVKKAAVVDGDMLTTAVSKLGLSLKQSKEFLNNEMSSLGEECEFRDTLSGFIQQADGDIQWMLEEEKRINALVKSTADYFHGTPGKDEGMRLFIIVRDFLVMVDKLCQEVKKSGVHQLNIPKKETPSASTSRESEQKQQQKPSPNVHEMLFPAIKEQRQYDSSSDDES